MGEEISQERITLMAIELRDIEPAILDKALGRARQECKFFPKPADILGFIRQDFPLSGMTFTDEAK